MSACECWARCYVARIELAVLAPCNPSGPSVPASLGKDNRVSEKTIEQILEERTDQWMAIPGVEGTAIGLLEGRPCITILSSADPQRLRAKIPETLEGFNVVIQQTGTFRARDGQ